MIRKLYKALRVVADFISGSHPNATICHPQWLAIRSQLACVRYAAQFACGLLVDVGCGQKPYLRFFRERVTKYVGVDFPLVADTLGGTRADVFATVLQIPIRSDSVDVVLFTEVLEHLPAPLPVLAELHRILKPQGVLILTTPMIYNIHGLPHDYLRFTPYGLRRVLEEAGFRVLDVRPQGYFGTMLCLMINNFITLFFARNRLLQAIRVTVLLPVLPLVFALWNVIGLVLDATVKGEEFAFNHLVIGQRGEGETGQWRDGAQWCGVTDRASAERAEVASPRVRA